MYLWKCWREYGKFVLGMIVLVVAVLCFLDSLLISHTLSGPQVKHELKEMNDTMLLLGGWLSAVFAGSAGSIAQEYDGRTTELLFTRPRRRRWLLWMNWLSGVIAIELVMLMPQLVSVAFIYARTHLLLDSRLFVVTLAAAPVNLMLFGIAQFGGVVLKGSSRGSVFAATVYGFYVTADALMRNHLGLDTPTWWFDKLLYAGQVSGITPFFCELVALWLLVAVAIPFATQQLLERRDMA